MKRIFPLSWRESALTWLPIAILLLLLDQYTKSLATQALYLGHSVPIFPGFNLTLVYNHGAAFGFLSDAMGWQRLFFCTIAVIAAIGFTIWLARTPKKNRLEGFGLTLLLGGAIGNLMDRLEHGYVIDFFDFYINFYTQSAHWPAFNLADSYICIGALCVILSTFVSNSKL